MAAAKWRVDSFHIGLGVVGDSAIHLLVEYLAKGPGVVHYALLVDGGDSGGEQRIQKAIAHIEQPELYDLSPLNKPAKANKLRFTAVVVSHWDTDHWTGVLFAMRDSIEAQAKLKPGEPISDLEVEFLQYDNTTSPRTPKTVVYAPVYGLPTKGCRLIRKPVKGTAAEALANLSLRNGEEADETIVNNVAKVRFEPFNPPKDKEPTLIGANIITGKDLPISKSTTKASYEAITNPSLLVTANPPDNPLHPGIYVVGVSTRIIGPPPGFEIVNDPRVRPKNESSLACMIIWPGSPPRLSHYFSGDMHWGEEDRIVRWTDTKGDRTKIGSWVTTVKASHHGSKSSTPTNMLKMFNPRSMIASTGEKNGHPSWELLFYLEGWMYNEGPDKASYRALLATQFPYYLLKQQIPGKDDTAEWLPLPTNKSHQMSMEILYSTSGIAKEYREELKEIYLAASKSIASGSGVTLTNPVDEWDAIKDTSPRPDPKAWARTRIAKAWARLSPVPPTAHAGIGTERQTGTKQIVGDANRLSWFRVESHNDKETDGTVWVKYDAELVETKLWPDPKAVPPTPMVIDLPSSPTIGVKRTTIDAFTTPETEDDPVLKKRVSAKLTDSVMQPVPALYNPAPGTNPDENDDMVEAMDEDVAVGPSMALVERPSKAGHSGTPILRPQPEPGVPGGPIGNPPELKSPFFFICSNAVKFLSPPGPEVKQLSLADALNNFLSTFHLQGLILANTPSLDTPMPLHDQDEFQKWMIGTLGTGASDPPAGSVTVIADPSTGSITEFVLSLPGLGLTYSSVESVKSLNVDGSWGPISLGDASTVPGQNSLILGLQKADKATGLSLTDILAPAIKRRSTLSGLKLLQKALGDKLSFKVDDSQGSRNAVWFEPMHGYKTTMRTQYLAEANSLSNMNSWIGGFLNDFSIQSIMVITKLQCCWTSTQESLASLNQWEFIFTTTVALEGVSIQPVVTFDFAGTLLTIEMQFNYTASGQGNLLSQIMSWIGNQKPLAGATFDFGKIFESAGSSNFDLPLLRRIILTVELDPDTGMPTGSINSARIDLELGVKFGRTSDEKVVFLFTYLWARNGQSVLRGSLWSPPPPMLGVDDRLLPEFEPYKEFEPSSVEGSNWAPCLDLRNLIPNDPKSSKSGGKVVNIPDGVPTKVIMAVLELNNSSISFRGAIECDEPKSDNVPKLFLSRLSLNASYTFASADFGLAFDFAAAMYPRKDSKIIPIELRGLLSYGTNDGFAIQAGVDTPGMLGAHFLDFFDEKSKSAATTLIQHIRLLYLQLEYRYENAKGPSNPAQSFLFSGALAIGKLELDLRFDYTGKDTWGFSARVGAFGEDCTIQDILDSIAGDGHVDLPSCVGNIVVPKPKPPTSAADDDADRDLFDLVVKRLDTDDDAQEGSQAVLFTVSVSVGPVSFTFLQFRNTAWDAKTTPSKRFLRLACHSIPKMEIPVIGDLTQPFDEMYFMWVQDGSKTTNQSTPPGLTMAEVKMLNKELGDNPIYYKLNKEAASYKETDVIVEAGCHFVLVLKDKAGEKTTALDYVFGKPGPKQDIPAPAVALRAHAELRRKYGANVIVRSRPRKVKSDEKAIMDVSENASTDYNPADAGGGTTKAAMKKSIGPFSISNIGLKFSNSTLSVCLDAEVAIGPIGMGMLGFSINVHFGGEYNLQNLPTPFNHGIDFSLKGLVVSFNKPPVTLAGGLFQQDLPSGTFWVGGVDVGFVPWAFLAAGGYGDLTDPRTQAKFKSAFVFAKLQGPLITLEFATISGVTGGLGYNSALKLPTIAEVPSFPFVKMPAIKPATGDPTLDTILTLVNGDWFKPLNDSFWVGAGFTVSAFEMLNVTAVAIVEWDTDVKLGLYAVAVADIPSSASPFKLAHVELGLLATIDFGKGVAKIEAQLSPSSYILDPTCHLSGGFALYYWFKDGQDQTKGDWVFTLGGYHSLYKPPPQYPVPPRLQIAWSLGPISILGQSYFALTPRVAMAGMVMRASLSLGVLQAYFDAQADFLINFKPFTFFGGGAVSVGVKFKLDLWFVTIRINVRIGASLMLQGPPIRGTCHVNFWVFGFDINFGSDQKNLPAPIHLLEFYNLVLQKGSPASASVTPVPHIFACKSGLLPSSGPGSSSLSRHRKKQPSSHRVIELGDDEDVAEDADEQVWAVHAGTFSFTISAVFALSTVTVYPESSTPLVYNAPKPETADIFSRPMYIKANETPITSNLKVSITLEGGGSSNRQPEWELHSVTTNSPKALWDAYNAEDDPTTGSNKLLNAKGSPTVPLMMGVLFLPPKPFLSEDKIQPFDAVLSQLQNVFPTPPALPDSTTKEDTAWLPVPATPPPKKDPAKPWEDVQSVWLKPGLGEGAGAESVSLWAKAMAWDDGAVSGAVPQHLVDGLQQLYVAAPMMAQAA